MKVAKNVFRFITVLGLITVLLCVVDYALPTKKVESIVVGRKMGIEGGRNRRHTHQLILIEEAQPFPVKISDRQEFNDGDVILVETSYLFHNQIRLSNGTTKFQAIPVLGLYSYFSVVIALLLFSGLFGVLYWNNTIKHMNSIPFTVFLIGIVLFLMIYY